MHNYLGTWLCKRTHCNHSRLRNEDAVHCVRAQDARENLVNLIATAVQPSPLSYNVRHVFVAPGTTHGS